MRLIFQCRRTFLYLGIITLLTGCALSEDDRLSKVANDISTLVESLTVSVEDFSDQPSNDLPGIGTFSMATANTQKPRNVRNHVMIFAGGGGGADCDWFTPEPTRQMPAFSQDTFEIFPLARNHTRAEVRIISCGWLTDAIEAVLKSPHGDIYLPVTTTRFEYTNSEVVRYRAMVSFELDNPQLGNMYTLVFLGPEGALQHHFAIVMPSSPQQFRLENRDLVLWRFLANERVRLYAYTEDSEHPDHFAKFVGYQDFITGNEGELYISVADKDLLFSVVGEKTGEINEPAIATVLIHD